MDLASTATAATPQGWAAPKADGRLLTKAEDIQRTKEVQAAR